MRLAVMGDIHSNHAALRACLASALSLGSEAFLLLGDYVSDCACPEKTLALLRALSSRFPCRFVAGNREEYMLNHLDGADDGWRSPSSASGSLLFTFRRLARRDFDFFAAFPLPAASMSRVFPPSNTATARRLTRVGISPLAARARRTSWRPFLRTCSSAPIRTYRANIRTRAKDL